MTTPLWRTAQVDPARAKALAERLSIPLRVARWLCARGLDAEDNPAQWLTPSAVPYTSPFAFSDMAAAVGRIGQAVRAGERIAVVGDYDVDGVTAAAILADTLGALGAECVCVLPHRERDGYGLSHVLVDRALAAGCRLLVTVDNGIRAEAAVLYALAQGLDVVVSDHHEPGEGPPPTRIPVVHWSRASHPDALKRLSGAGVAWKLCQALLTEAGGLAAPAVERARVGEAFRLGLAALGALADVMPMIGETRRLVVEGLAALRRCRRPGWLALCAVSGVDADSVTASDVLWRIAPRLNSAGRMDTAEHALALLLAADPGEAQARAEDIERLNGLRKVETERAFTQAQEQAREQIAAGCGFLVSHGPWPLGVVGIVAAKLSETYGMPALVLADTGDTLLRGSGRAPSGFPLHQALADSAELFDHFGGHDEAVGCGLSRERLVEVRERLSAFAAAWQSERLPSASTPQVLADDYLPLADATLELAAWIDRLGPYGPGHPMWRFCVGPARIVQVRWMGDGRHVRIKVSEAGNFQDLVWFHAPPSVSTWKPGDTVTAIVELEQNVWQGRVRVQLRVIQAGLSNRVLTREHFADLYRLLRARRRLQAVEAVREAPGYGLDQVATMLNTFVELGFARLSDHAYHVVESAAPRDLREAAHYRDHLRTNAAWSV